MSDFTYPFYQSQVPDLFGDPNDPSFAPTYPRTIDFTDLLPNFSHVRNFEGNPWTGKIYGNGYCAAPLRAALGALIAKGIADQWHTYDGMFNIRQAKGGDFYRCILSELLSMLMPLKILSVMIPPFPMILCYVSHELLGMGWTLGS